MTYSTPYSRDTMERMEESIRAARLAMSEVGTAAETVAESINILNEEGWPGIGDTCCGECGAGLCYVDEVTGA